MQTTRPALTFVRHYAEMVVAMFVGMVVLGAPLGALLGVAGVDVAAWDTDAPELLLLGMAFTMSIPMAAWMRYRGHIGMLPSMLAVMLLRLGEYTGHAGHRHATA